MVMLYVYSRSIVTYMTHCHSHDPLSIICNVCQDMEIHVRNIDQPQAIAWFPDPSNQPQAAMNSEMCRVGLNICGVSHDVNMPLRLQFEVRSIDLTSDGVSAGSHCLRDYCLCSVNRRSSPAPKHIALACSAPHSCQVISRGNYPATPPHSTFRC